jgi:hypothetical protein
MKEIFVKPRRGKFSKGGVAARLLLQRRQKADGGGATAYWNSRGQNTRVLIHFEALHREVRRKPA